MSSGPLRERAERLDAVDPLAGYLDRFVVTEPGLIYLDGNSLGRLPHTTVDAVRGTLEQQWGEGLIGSWEHHWMALPTLLGDLLGQAVLGAGAGQVVVGDSTTVNIYKAVSAALDAAPGRTDVVVERDGFPTDRYVVESLARRAGGKVRWLEPPGPDGVRPGHLDGLLDPTVAAVVLSHVDYRSAALLDLPSVTAAIHAAGALAVWDLCHSVGVVPIDLDAAEADLAVGCTYKYLNGGPGAPAFTYVRRDLQPSLSQPIWGWWGRADMMAMPQGYQPVDGVGAWLAGTPPVLSMAAVEPGVRLVAEAGVPAIRAKSMALTALAVQLYDEWLAPAGFGLATSRDPARRGSHITVTHPDAESLVGRLVEAGVVPDFRRPDGIRLGFSPLTTRFVDVHDGLWRLARLAVGDRVP